MMPEKLVSLLYHCAKTKAFRNGLSLHASAVKTGTCDHFNSARKVFDEVSDRNLVSWSAIISSFDQSNEAQSVLQLFSRTQSYFKLDEFVFASALSSCSSVKDLNLGRQIHAQALKLSHASVSFVQNSLILMYMKCGLCTDSLLSFSDQDSGLLTLVSYNIAITGLVENKQQQEGIEMFKIMCRRGLVPDRFTFAGLLRPGELMYHLSVVMQLHCQMVKLGLDYTAFSGNVLITLYSKFGLVGESEKVFRSMKERDAISWNAFISACCRCEDNSMALSTFREMILDHDVRPDDFTYASALSAVAALAYLGHGKEVHAHLTRTRLDWDVGVGNALVNMYSKSGSIGSAYASFQRMKARNIVSWNSMIAAFANHGLGENAIAFFHEMLRTELKPDSVTFLELLTACSHSGLASQGKDVFNSMTQVYGINPNPEHLCCLVDLLGRAGMVSEAEEYIHRYSIGDDTVVLGSLLSSCRLHEGIIVGEHIAKRLIDLHPVSTSPYVLLSNLYASDRKWDDAERARKMLRVSGLKKEAAQSLI